MKKSREYLENLTRVLDEIVSTQTDAIDRAAAAFASALERNSRIFLFGTGHSHMLAEELFYRAGGLVEIRPVLEPALMLHVSASNSTLLERQPGWAQKLFADYGMQKNDVLVVISNSGRNGVCVDLALLAKEHGLVLIALTNRRHADAGASRHPSGKKLYELADIVLDNCGCVGDASVYFEQLDRRVAPTSTAAGAAILNAVVAGCVEIMLSHGVQPEVFASSNIDGGDEINAAFIEKYKGQIRSL